jgi:hypothetical protein
MTGDGMPEAPTEQQVYQLYQDVLDDLNRVINNTIDQQLIDLLNPVAQSLSDWLTEANELQLEANTALFKALTPEMKSANVSLKNLKEQIAGVADKIADVGKLVAGVTQVLELTGKFA